MPSIRYSVARKAGHIMNSCALRVGWPGFVAETMGTLNEGTTFPSARMDSREVARIGCLLLDWNGSQEYMTDQVEFSFPIVSTREENLFCKRAGSE